MNRSKTCFNEFGKTITMLSTRQTQRYLKGRGINPGTCLEIYENAKDVNVNNELTCALLADECKLSGGLIYNSSDNTIIGMCRFQ